MSLDILDDPFAGRATTSISESRIRDISASMPDTKVQDLLRAADNENWDKQEGVNEKFLLGKEVASVASFVSAELGPFALDMYEQAQPVMEAGVLRLINEGDRTGAFRGENARGGSQWDVAQIGVGSLNPVNDPGARVYETGGSGDFNIAPALGEEGNNPVTDNRSDPTAPVGSEGNGTHALDTDTQAVFILGMYGSTNPRAVEQAKIDVDDGEERTPFDIYGHQNLGTLQAQGAPSVEYITDDDTFDINGSATQNTTVDLFPFGLDVNTAANLPGLSTRA